MYHVLKKHSRRILAVAGALLMVAFLLPTMGNPSSFLTGEQSIGKAFGKKIRISQEQQALHDWYLLKERIFLSNGMPLAAYLGQTAYPEIEQHGELFLLLLLDANRQGIYVTDSQVQDVLNQVKLGQGLDIVRNRDDREVVTRAIASFLKVRGAFDRATSAVQVSQPAREWEIATRMQELKVSTVDYPVDAYLNQVSQPSQEQIQAFFEKYKAVDPATVESNSTTNPFGFGYKFPDRVKVQYLTIPAAEVRAAVLASRSEFEWEKEANKYYKQNLKQFVAPARQPGLDTNGLEMAKQPATTQPFAQVKEQAKDAVVQPELQKLQATILTRINGILVADYNNFRQAKDGEKPVSSLGVPFDSYDYLQKIAETIQKEYQVRIAIGQVPDLLSIADLSRLTNLGSLRKSETPSGVPFPAYATMSEEVRKARLNQNPGLPPALKPYQPSQRMDDPQTSDISVFRVTEMSPAHTPRDLAEVGEQRVVADLKRQQAFELAAKAADEFVQNARKEGLAKAAASVKKNVTEATITPGGRPVIGLHLSTEGNAVYIPAAATALLELKAANQEKPVAAIPVARDNRIVVTQLNDVKNGIPQELARMLEMQIVMAKNQEIQARLDPEWFKYQNVVQRTGFEPAEKRRRQDEQEQPGGRRPTGPLGL